jgi:hypothetical protein
MAHFAKVENGIVTQVIVIDWETLNQEGHPWGDPSSWVQTSYNTYGGQHPENRPLRKNYAGVGYTYDSTRDAFIAPSPFPSWVLNEDTCLWGAPTPMPVVEGKIFVWNEPTTAWIEFVPPATETPTETPTEG